MHASGGTIAEVGERGLIARIRARLPAPPEWVALGIGDDAAVLEPERNRLEVLTTDVLVEHVHFTWATSAPADVGFKALAVNLSDLAAMGAAPRAALLSLLLPGTLPLASLDGVLDGLLDLAGRHRIAIVGGNLSSSPGPFVIDLTVLGTAGRRRVLTRAGARPGDDLYVSGTVGLAGTALEWLRRQDGARAEGSRDWPVELLPSRGRLLRPEPRVWLGLQLGRNRLASACMDLSDGLADAVRQVAEASGVGMVIDASAVPIEAGARAWLTAHGLDPVTVALGAGEDYELLFTVPRRVRRPEALLGRIARDLPVTRIGTVTRDRELVLKRDGRDEPLPSGFAHF